MQFVLALQLKRKADAVSFRFVCLSLHGRAGRYIERLTEPLLVVEQQVSNWPTDGLLLEIKTVSRQRKISAKALSPITTACSASIFAAAAVPETRSAQFRVRCGNESWLLATAFPGRAFR